MGFLAAGLEAVGPRATADRDGRNALRLRLRKLRHEGITRTVAFDQRVRTFDITTGTGLFLHRVEAGRPRVLGPFGEAGPHWATGAP